MAKRAVVICGQICSGKSSIVRHLRQAYGWDTVSFGNYVRYIAHTTGLQPSREAFQRLGDELFRTKGPNQFLAEVIEFSQPLSHIHLYDSVRHRAMIEALQQVYNDVCVIMLSASNEERYERFKLRVVEGDTQLSFNEFLRLTDHPVERGISELQLIAACCVESKLFKDTVLSVERCLRNRNYL